MKFNLKTFTSSNTYIIEDPQQIIEITNEFWKIPFKNLFHEQWHNASINPWKYLYEELKYEGLINCPMDSFLELTFGEVSLLLEQLTITELNNDTNEDKILYFLLTFGKVYTNFI